MRISAGVAWASVLLSMACASCSKEAPSHRADSLSSGQPSSVPSSNRNPVQSSSVAVTPDPPPTATPKPSAAELAKLAKLIELSWENGSATLTNRGDRAIRHVSFSFTVRDSSGKTLDLGSYNFSMPLEPGASKKPEIKQNAASKTPGARTEMRVTWLILTDGTDWKEPSPK